MNSRFRDIEKAYRGISTGGYQAVCDYLEELAAFGFYLLQG